MKCIDNPSNARVKIESRHMEDMDNTIIVPQSVRVLVKMGNKRKGSGVDALVGMLKEYKDKYTSVELQKEAMKWWKFYAIKIISQSQYVYNSCAFLRIS